MQMHFQNETFIFPIKCFSNKNQANSYEKNYLIVKSNTTEKKKKRTGQDRDSIQQSSNTLYLYTYLLISGLCVSIRRRRRSILMVVWTIDSSQEDIQNSIQMFKGVCFLINYNTTPNVIFEVKVLHVIRITYETKVMQVRRTLDFSDFYWKMRHFCLLEAWKCYIMSICL